ncbi:PLDc N-terminal domain-containing protein [Agromyces marinus]|uniref:PLDc N-terminal domain-containing protein n=1 Tax=Agromyces marinus TaxID=1389020 RepID=UPI001F278878|nr:PLDc N-terminal domain-containing protein [Agromyces marinus]UIP59872.1 hypothetical protein DSM26151_27860 [Agromyces marinus]
MDLVSGLVVTMVAAVVLAAFVFAIVQIVRNESLNSIEKVAWIAAVLCFPLAGAIVWFAAGPHPFGLRIQRQQF